MSKPDEKLKAIELRRRGLSYREVLRHVPVANSTLSLWLRQVGLSRTQTQRLTAKRLAAGRRGGEKVRALRQERIRQTRGEAEHEARRRLEHGEEGHLAHPTWIRLWSGWCEIGCSTRATSGPQIFVTRFTSTRGQILLRRSTSGGRCWAFTSTVCAPTSRSPMPRRIERM